jgi:hypothetical protein
VTSPGGTSGNGAAGLAPGYTELASDGGIFNFGTQFFGSMGGQVLNCTCCRHGVDPRWPRLFVGGVRDGGIFSYGDAAFYGSTGSKKLNKPIVAMTTTPDGKGYWLIASDGAFFLRRCTFLRFNGRSKAQPTRW